MILNHWFNNCTRKNNVNVCEGEKTRIYMYEFHEAQTHEDREDHQEVVATNLDLAGNIQNEGKVVKNQQHIYNFELEGMKTQKEFVPKTQSNTKTSHVKHLIMVDHTIKSSILQLMTRYFSYKYFQSFQSSLRSF